MQVRDVAFGERDDVDAGEGETLEEAGGVFLVATEALQFQAAERESVWTSVQYPHNLARYTWAPDVQLKWRHEA